MISFAAHLLLLYMLIGWPLCVAFLVAMDRKDMGQAWWQVAWQSPLCDLVLTLMVGAVLTPIWPFLVWAWWRGKRD